MTVLQSLCTLCICDVQLSLEEFGILSNGLRQQNRLEHLSLDKCKLHDGHVRILSLGLWASQLLKSLSLRENYFGDEGIMSLIENWSADSNMEELDFQCNAFGPFGAQHLLQASLARPSMKCLDLSDNRTIGFDGLRMMGEALCQSSGSLQELWISGAAIPNAWFDKTSKLAQAQELKITQAAQALLNGVRRSVHLQALNGNFYLFIPCHLANEIDFYLQLNRECGRKLLQIQQFLPTNTVWCFLLAKFSVDPSIVFYYLRELPMLMSTAAVNRS